MIPWLIVGVLGLNAMSAEEERQKKKRKKRKKKARKKAAKRVLRIQDCVECDAWNRAASTEAVLSLPNLDPRVRARLERHR